MCGQVGTENDLKAYSVGLKETKPEMLLAAQGDKDFDAQTGAKVSASLRRIYSMITVKVVRNNLSDGLVINPKSVQLKHIPTTGFLFQNNKIENENQCQINGEKIERTSGATDFLTADHDKAPALYMFENRQPEGSNGGDQTTKTPAGLKPDALVETIKTDRKCSYIEVVADYLKGGNSGVAGSGTITYRFFLGKDELTDFDVERNVHYLVTLTLNGDGGKDEATWRVETDLMKEMNVPNAYIGYRVGSQTEIQATGDFKNGTVTSSDPKISVSYDRATGKIIVEALETNTHDYEKQSYQLKYTLDGVTKTAYVYQVPRLVDPIAYYMKANNTSQQFVEVKEFNKTNRAYTNLVSEGPWTATIVAGNWFDLYKEQGDSRVHGEEAAIQGDGEVKFYFQPRGVNTNNDRLSGATLNTETSDGARYGIIRVEYHNGKCPHEIFLRQGYQPTTLGQAEWSMFNCIGKDGNDAPQITEYPTSTGWFFKGGNDIGINPYKPGYLVNPNGTLYFSNGKTGGFNDNSYSDTHWGKTSGPCPAGYKVADSYDFEKLVKASTVYTGFVHDDGPAGWRYNGTQVVLEENDYCNPAKGSLFVSTDGTGKSVFFTFGKGVLTQHPDGAYIDEIGVGHRGTNGGKSPLGVLTYDEWDGNTKKYGAIYWTSTRFGDSSMSSHIGKADFSYDILKSTPYSIDVPTDKYAQGLHGGWHGNFVRCVRESIEEGGGETTISFKPAATFKYYRNIWGESSISSGKITVSYGNGNTASFNVSNGKATGNLTLPSNINIVNLSFTSGRNTYQADNISVSDLRNSSKTIILTQ